jgi:cyclopropane fatty-acyl-phospholipid synthase-like methyltransferase
MLTPMSLSIQIPEHVFVRIGKGMGTFFSKLNRSAPEILARDMLDTARTVRAHEVLRRYINPEGRRILEVGSGYGITLISWTKNFGLDVTGTEPGGGWAFRKPLRFRGICAN